MAKFLFWNINQRPITPLIVRLAREQAIDVAILAESRIPVVTLLEALNAGEHAAFVHPYNPSSRLQIFVRYPETSLGIIRDTEHLAIRLLRPPVGLEIIVVAAHLPSKRNYTDSEQTQLCTRIPGYIEAAEEKAGHRRTLIVGDLNMNPFEQGIVGSEGLHAASVRQIALRESRMVAKERKQFFYNPMWNYFGERTPGPPGTYYYNHAKPLTYYWNIFDQVLVRPALIPLLDEQSIQIITAIGDHQLLGADGRPHRAVGSDHLPLVFDLEIEKEARV